MAFWSQRPSRIKSSLKLSDLCQPLFFYCVWPPDSPLQIHTSTCVSLVTGWRAPLRGRCSSSEAVLPLSTQTHSVAQDQKSHISFRKSSFTILALTGCLRLWNSTQSFHKGKITLQKMTKVETEHSKTVPFSLGGSNGRRIHGSRKSVLDVPGTSCRCHGHGRLTSSRQQRL